MSSVIVISSAPILKCFVSSSHTALMLEKTLQKELTIAQLKTRLEIITGSQSSHMTLEVYNSQNNLICKLDNDDNLLGSYPIDDGFRIHVVDPHGTAAQYHDVSKIDKYELSTDEYNSRTDSVRAFKQKMKIGQFTEMDPEEKAKKEEEIKKKEEELIKKEKFLSENVGARCEVSIPGQAGRRGKVAYAGKTEFKAGFWVGIQYDEPVGKNNGSVGGVKYFDCSPKYGGFVKAGTVEVGDFPEQGIDSEDEI